MIKGTNIYYIKIAKFYDYATCLCASPPTSPASPSGLQCTWNCCPASTRRYLCSIYLYKLISTLIHDDIALFFHFHLENFLVLEEDDAVGDDGTYLQLEVMVLQALFQKGDLILDITNEALEIFVFFLEKLKIFVLFCSYFLKVCFQLPKLILLHTFG